MYSYLGSLQENLSLLLFLSLLLHLIQLLEKFELGSHIADLFVPRILLCVEWRRGKKGQEDAREKWKQGKCRLTSFNVINYHLEGYVLVLRHLWRPFQQILKSLLCSVGNVIDHICAQVTYTELLACHNRRRVDKHSEWDGVSHWQEEREAHFLPSLCVSPISRALRVSEEV